MDVTKVEAVTKTKWKVELDGQFAFVLYKGELSRFSIKEGGELPEEVYEKIKKEVVLKRAKLRAMHLLTDMARTEAGLREKLRQGMYPDDVVEEALAYVKSFGYLDDYKYAENLIQSRQGSKSRKELYALLSSKGVPQEQIELAMENCYDGGGEQEAIRGIIRKKKVDILHASEPELHKLYGYLARKGFRYEDIRQVIAAIQPEEARIG